MNRIKGVIGAVLTVAAVLSMCGCIKEKTLSVESASVVTEDIANLDSYKAYEATYPQKTVHCIAQGDVSGDGISDLIVIYEKDSKEMNTVAIVSGPEGWIITEPVKAPFENQRIELKNIDNKGLTEMIISGSRNGNFGMGIFRLESGKLVDLFNEGMEDCC